MAKGELPYFKFEASKWLLGKISIEPMEVQGIFINICALYWQKNGVLEISEIYLRFKKKKLIDNLCGRFFSQCDGIISIDFLDEQITERQLLANKNSENAFERWKNKSKNTDATALRPQSDGNAKLYNKEVEEEKSREEVEKIRTEEEKNKISVEKISTPLYSEYLKVYFDWFENRVGVKPQFMGMDARALKSLIKYLKNESKEKSYEGGLVGWKWILDSWPKIEPFIQNQTSVVQIQKNINNILNQLRNGKPNKNSRPDPTDFAKQNLEALRNQQSTGV